MSHRIKPLIGGVRIVGPAITLWDVASVGDGDLFLTLEAMDNAHSGDVIVKGVDIIPVSNIVEVLENAIVWKDKKKLRRIKKALKAL